MRIDSCAHIFECWLPGNGTIWGGGRLGGVALLEELHDLGFQKTGAISSELSVPGIELNVTLSCC